MYSFAIGSRDLLGGLQGIHVLQLMNSMYHYAHLQIHVHENADERDL